MNFKDGLVSFLSELTNKRSASSANSFISNRISDQELRAIYKTGLASKIYRVKTGYALNKTLEFKSEGDKDFYNSKLAKAVKRAAMFQLGFGRGIIVIHDKNAELDKPLKENVNLTGIKFDVFPGEMISAPDISRDLSDERYYKPLYYIVRGFRFHWTRVIDFTYYEPVEGDKSTYNYGGISEAELIYTQLVNDGVIERAGGSIVEKLATLFYKTKGFKQRLQNKQETQMVEYFSRVEDSRSIHGATLIDSEDDVTVVSQTLTGIGELNDVSLRRLAMVTGIPLPMLVGENVKGLNSAGDTERDTFNDTIEAYQDLYLIDPINELMTKLGKNPVEFAEDNGMNPTEEANYEKIIIGNALQLSQMGGDFDSYLKDKGITNEEDDFAKMFPEDKSVDLSKVTMGDLKDGL